MTIKVFTAPPRPPANLSLSNIWPLPLAQKARERAKSSVAGKATLGILRGFRVHIVCARALGLEI